MGPGRTDQEWPTSPPRLVPQSDGYADYAAQSWPGSAGRQAGQPAGPPPGQPGAASRQLGRGQDGGRAPYAGHRRKERRGVSLSRGAFGTGRAARQRSIRSTITILLVIPLLSLIALWAYAAVSTVGESITFSALTVIAALLSLAVVAAFAMIAQTAAHRAFLASTVK